MSRKLLQINFKFRGPAADLSEEFYPFAHKIAEHPGLVWKIWLMNERLKEAGGIYLFEQENALNRYLESPMVAFMKRHPAISEISFKIFDITEASTAITRGPVAV